MSKFDNLDIYELQTILSFKEADINALFKDLIKREKEVETIKNNLDDANKTINDFKKELDDTNKTISNKDGEIEKINLELDNVKDEINDLKECVHSKNEEITKLNVEIVSLNKKVDDANKVISLRDERIEELKEGIKNFKEQSLSKDNTIEQLEETIVSKNKNIDSKNGKILNLNNLLNEHKEKLIEMDNGISNLKNQIESNEKEIDNLNSQLEQASQDLDNSQNDGVKKLQLKLESKNEEYKKLEQRYSKIYGLFKEQSRSTKGNISIEQILECFDDFEVVLSNDKFMDFLFKNGLTEIPTIGRKFDSNKHVSIDLKGNDGDLIIEEIEKGYVFNNTVLKQSKVNVSKDTIFTEDISFNPDSDEVVLGINFSDDYFVMAGYSGLKPIIISPNEGSSKIGKVFTNSLTYDGNNVIIGNSAKKKGLDYCSGSKIKRLLGSDEKIVLNNKEYDPHMILVALLTKIKADAEEFLGKSIKTCVISVPNNFKDDQIKAIGHACDFVGFDKFGFVNESLAACFAYNSNNDLNYIVYNMGKSSLDVSVININGGNFEIKSSSSDINIGSKFINDILIKYIADEFEKENNINILDDEFAVIRLIDAIEGLKLDLVNSYSAEIFIPNIVENDDFVSLDLKMTISKAQFENLIDVLINGSLEIIEEVLNFANMGKDDIDKVILIGQDSKISSVENLVKKFVGKDIEKIHPLESVAIGAARRGYDK